MRFSPVPLLLCAALVIVAVVSLKGAGTLEQAEAARQHMPQDGSFAAKLVHAALDRTHHTVRYTPDYVQLSYPGGDVPEGTGVCTDEVIRSYRALGFDLQKLVHEDMKRAFGAYPKNWGLSSTDKNIDHRRVPNLQTFFKRKGASLPITQNAADYKPGISSPAPWPGSCRTSPWWCQRRMAASGPGSCTT